jgi:hypothetical protein
MKSTLCLCLGLFLAPVFSASAQTVPAFWTTINPGAMSAEGTLGPVIITATQLGSPGTFSGDLSGPDYSGRLSPPLKVAWSTTAVPISGSR